MADQTDKGFYKTPEVDTSMFEASHGHKPRGNGWWWFELKGSGRGWNDERWVECSKSYSEAKKGALRRTRALRFSTVILLP